MLRYCITINGVQYVTITGLTLMLLSFVSSWDFVGLVDLVHRVDSLVMVSERKRESL